VVVVGLVFRDEGLGVAPVEPGLEEDGRRAAGAKVERGALELGGAALGGGVAGLDLGLALSLAAGEGAAVGGVGAGLGDVSIASTVENEKDDLRCAECRTSAGERRRGSGRCCR
jgi:hypothetical protein